MNREYIQQVVETVALRAALKGTGRNVYELSDDEKASMLRGVGVLDACMEIDMVTQLNPPQTRGARGVHMDETHAGSVFGLLL